MPARRLPVEVIGGAVPLADPDVGSAAESPDWIAMGWQLPVEFSNTVSQAVTFTAGRIHRERFAV